MKDQALENTIKVIQVIAIIIVVSLVAAVMYDGVILGGFKYVMNYSSNL